MSSRQMISRRHFLGGLAAAPALIVRDDLPVITKRVEKLYTVAGCRQPNDLQGIELLFSFAPCGRPIQK